MPFCSEVLGLESSQVIQSDELSELLTIDY